MKNNALNYPLSTPQRSEKRIALKQQSALVARQLQTTHGLTPITARVLAARGFVSDERLANFLTPTLKEGLPAPEDLKGLAQACSLIRETIEKNQGIAVCCDFDVDGLSGGAQVYHFLRQLGVRCKVYVPDRFEDGYGLNIKMVEAIASSAFALIITVDYGTTNVVELTRAKELGLRTIVIDHHHVAHAAPPADVFVNPKQPGCGFAGEVLSAAGLAWYLIIALRSALKQAAHIDPRSYLDLACLGTVCDMVPLVGANRVIAKRGLEALLNTPRPGLIALKDVVGIRGEVSCRDLGFGIGPRLNAAGRMVHGDLVVELLTTPDSVLAKQLANRLNTLNTQRQSTENEVKERATQAIMKLNSLPAGIVIWDSSFHTGVVGIVAQRLVESFYRPSVVLGLDSPGFYKGSVRGIRNFNVIAALSAVGEHLVKFGGHEGAGGLTIAEHKLEDFRTAFEAECDKRIASDEYVAFAEADTETTLQELDLKTVDELQKLAPFGIGNPNPQLLIRGLKVLDVRSLKEAHTKVTLSEGKRFITGLMWRRVGHPALYRGANVDVVFRAESSTYAGTTELQLNLQTAELTSLPG